MTGVDVSLPDGYSLSFFERLDSTNAEALRQAGKGAPDRHWIWTRIQTAGRGREGRSWDSAPGNLFASLLLRPACPPGIMSQLGLVAGLAVHQAVSSLAGAEHTTALTLKWPNDVLFHGRKLAGVLLETATMDAPSKNAIALGMGLNIANHPENASYPATDLSSHGIMTTPGKALETLSFTTASWLKAWDEGRGFDQIRTSWSERAMPIGAPIRVNVGGEPSEGVYGGLDEDGALVLRRPDGSRKRITAGDVFVIQQNHQRAGHGA